jgi:hypothetical protein
MDGLPRWVPAPEPDLSIGVVEGEDGYQFSEIGAVRTLSDGRIVVANEQPIALRYFSSDRSFLFSVGREGDGAGEFRFLRDVWVLRGDSLLVSDMRNRRLTVLDPDGSVAREDPIPADMPGLTRAAGAFDDGSVLFSAPGANAAAAYARASTAHLLVRVSANADRRDTIARLETPMVEAPNGRQLVPTQSNFAPRLSGVAAAARVVWTPGIEFSVWLAEPSGGIEQAWRYEIPRAPMGEVAFDAWVDSGAVHVGDPDSYSEFMRARGYPDSLPSIGRLRSSRPTGFWLRV